MSETPDSAQPYEPPRIERVVTPEDVEREILYAGAPGPSQVDAPQA